ncbi:hypothetical protein ED733_003430 [Metarhizium rileyi]|uniref:Uncharacterized protein n=1 Tax=Metarhizium rileyi (strain RCEF 4871) TaxID=1649241 RepID=A0A5C6G937_METRR|nr:hypothetical protein ED733_003430 [Metarhizium rileyi]
MASRSEFKYDVFQHDVSDIVSAIEKEYREINRPTSTTLTLYFDGDQGSPSVDLSFRLRTYGHFERGTTTLQDIKSLPWRAEKKFGEEKTTLGSLPCLPDGEAWQFRGATRRPRSLKVCERRHFAMGELDDESRRVTIDLSRSLYYISGQSLVPIGDMGPRIEVKLPSGMSETHFALAHQLRAANHWMEFSSLTNYSQFVLATLFPSDTHMALPEIESKYAITSGSAEQVFNGLLAFLASEQRKWHLVLPYPHIMIRTRRYHVCQGLRPGSTATIVETSSGRCSVKIKDDARSQGSVLLRTTQASHTTDINGQMMSPGEFAAAHGLEKINEFTKLQRKIPIALANGHGFLFTVDLCTDPRRRSLAQVEIEYMGSTDGRVPPTEQVLREIQNVGRAMLASPIGLFLSSTHLTKHAFFAKDARPEIMASAT